MSKKITALLVLAAILMSTAVFNVTASETTIQIANFDIDSLELENDADIYAASILSDGSPTGRFSYNGTGYFLYLTRSSASNVNITADGEKGLDNQTAKISFAEDAYYWAGFRMLRNDVNGNRNNAAAITARTSDIAYSFDLKMPEGINFKVTAKGLPSTATSVKNENDAYITSDYLTSTLFEVSSGSGTSLKSYSYTKDTTSSPATSTYSNKFKRGEFANFKVIVDYDEGKFDLYVNNHLVSADNGLAGTKFLSDFLIQIEHQASYDAVETYIDNLSYRILSDNDLSQVYVSDGIENGTLTLNETFTEVGKPITFNATPDAGYKLTSVTLDGKAIDGLTFDRAGGTYTIDSLPYGGELKAVFEEKRTTTKIAGFDIDSLELAEGTAIANKTAYNYNESSYFVYTTTTGNGKLTVDGTDNQVLKVYGASGAYSAGTVKILRNDLNANRNDKQKEIRTNDIALTFNVKVCVGTVLEVSAMGLPSTATISKNPSTGWMPDAVDSVTPKYITSTILSCGRSGTGGNTYSYTKDSTSDPTSKYVDKIVTRDEYVNYKILFDYDEGTYDVYKNDELIAENNGLAGPQFLSDFTISLHHQSGYSNSYNVEAYLDDICFYTMAEEDTNIQPSVVKTGSGTVTADKFLVKEGEDITYTITPDEGKYIRNIYLDGEAIPAFNSEGTTYTIPNITSRRTLKVDFGSYEEGKPIVMVSPLMAKEGNKTYMFCKLLPNSAEVSSYGILLSKTNEVPSLQDETTKIMPFYGETDALGYPVSSYGYFGYALSNNSGEIDTSFYVRPYVVVDGEYVYGTSVSVNTADLEELEGIE